MKQQSKWTVTFTDGEKSEFFADHDATEEQARAKLVRLLRHNRETLILDSSPSRIPEVLEAEARSARSHDFDGMIEKIERIA